MRVSNSLLRSPTQRFHHLQNPVRFAGGGGRPGGRPAFNWKEKLLLRLGSNEKKMPWKNRPFGDFEAEIMPYFDASRGDVIVDITNMSDWKEPVGVSSGTDERNNDKKKVKIPLLFGSNKSFGLLSKNSTSVGRKHYSRDSIAVREESKQVDEINPSVPLWRIKMNLRLVAKAKKKREFERALALLKS